MKCKEWNKGKNAQGYGQRWYKGKNVLAHRAAYCEAHGLSLEDIKGVVIRHTCDNPPCVNPKHLLPGTHQDNYDDMVARGRRVHRKPKGTKRPAMPIEQVRDLCWDLYPSLRDKRGHKLACQILATRAGHTVRTIQDLL